MNKALNIEYEVLNIEYKVLNIEYKVLNIEYKVLNIESKVLNIATNRQRYWLENHEADPESETSPFRSKL